MSGGAKILAGLKEAVEGNIARVTIEGVVWTRSDLMDVEKTKSWKEGYKEGFEAGYHVGCKP